MRAPLTLHDPDYARPIRARYCDPAELVWLSTAARLGLTVRRDESIFSMTDGTGLLALGPRETLDPDDTLPQMVFHEICHWIVNGLDSFHERDWGFPLDDELDLREHACQRLQLWLSSRYGLREVLAPTSGFRQYYDQIVAPLAPLDDSEWERAVVACAEAAITRSDSAPWAEPVHAALQATAALKSAVEGFLGDFRSEVEGDELPCLWGR